jgi:NAD(P)H dehydrogenase (quinone)
MYAIAGITGKVGGELARNLLAAGQRVRAIVRNASKGEEWATRGCEVALAKMEDGLALADAFTGATATFILAPPEFDPEPGYPEARAVIDGVVEALTKAKPARVLCLSTIGADAVHDNLLSQHTMMEDLASACETGLIHTFLQPAYKAFPMVAAKDVGRLAADLIQEAWTDTRVVELEGPCRVTPNDLAAAFATVIGKSVHVRPVRRDLWSEWFRSQGMKNPGHGMRMLDCFNEGWIEFQDRGCKAIKGQTSAVAVIAALVAEMHPLCAAHDMQPDIPVHP